ncbi:hypothetical protein NEOLEDRAFT_1038675, partial [Neolentinus lepideus HHB14362 ss-1]
RIYTQRTHLPSIRDWSITSSVVPTDHRLLTLRFSPLNAPRIGAGRWTWPLGLINDDVLLEKIITKGIALQNSLTANDGPDIHNAQRLWQTYKTDITQTAKQHAKVSLAKITSRIRAMQEDLTRTQNDPQLDHSDDLRTHAMLL